MTNAILTSGVAFAACRFHSRRFVERGGLRTMLIALWMLCIGAPLPLRAEEPARSPTAAERSVKAAFLFKFLGYVEWPSTVFSQPDSPINIGVLGADDIAVELQQISAGRTGESRPVMVRRQREGDSLTGLHALFVAPGEAGRLPAIARVAHQRSILVVSDNAGALDQGSVINFLITDGKVRFEISLEAAERSSLKLSSRLLAVAQLVRTGT
jgi:hypothetical protein